MMLYKWLSFYFDAFYKLLFLHSIRELPESACTVRSDDRRTSVAWTERWDPSECGRHAAAATVVTRHSAKHSTDSRVGYRTTRQLQWWPSGSRCQGGHTTAACLLSCRTKCEEFVLSLQRRCFVFFPLFIIIIITLVCWLIFVPTSSIIQLQVFLVFMLKQLVFIKKIKIKTFIEKIIYL